MLTKFQSFRGELAQYWSCFLARCLAYPAEHPIDLALAHLATGEEKYSRLFLEQLMRFVEELPKRDITNQAQFHQWTNALPAIRWALAYDWIADSGVISTEQHTRIARAFLAYAERQWLPVANSRVVTGDNQFFSVCFACAVCGELFGRRHHQSAMGRNMAEHAQRRLADAIGHLPSGGYSGEGYYHNQVVSTLVSLYGYFFEAQGHASFFDFPYPPNKVSIRDVLTVDYHTIMPGGIMVPWDASLFHPVHVKMNLVYLAQRSGDARYLHPIKRYRMFEGDPRPGWGRDDDAWTWFWWPETITSLEMIPAMPMPCWARDGVGFGLNSADSETGLFQNFDESHRFDAPSATRAQSDPNNLVLIGHASPLLLDGGYAELADVKGTVPSERVDRNGKTGFGYHNCLVIDGEYAARVPATTAGTLRRFLEMPGLSLGEGDVSTAYRNYAFEQITRRSMQLDDEMYLFVDELRAPRAHDVTWQLFTRPYAQYRDGRYELTTPEGVHLAILPPEGRHHPIERVEGMPEIMEEVADRLRVSTHGDALILRTIMKVEKLADPILLLTDGWEVALAPNAGGIPADWTQANAPWPVLGIISLERHAATQLADFPIAPLPQRYIWDYMDRRLDTPIGNYDAVSYDNAVYLRRRFMIPDALSSQQYLLQIERPPWYFQLFLDGELIAGEGIASPTQLGRSNHVPPATIPLALSCSPGIEHELVLVIASPYASTAVGAVTLLAAHEAPAFGYQPVNEAAGLLQHGETETAIVWRNLDHAVLTVREMTTDAEVAVCYADGHWAVMDAGILLLHDQPVLWSRTGSICASYKDRVLTIAELGPFAVCEMCVPEGRLVIFGGVNPQIVALLHAPLIVRCAPREDAPHLPSLLCAQMTESTRHGDMFHCLLTPSSIDVARCMADYAQGNAFERIEALHRLVSSCDARVAELFIHALSDERWSVRCTAARLLGNRMERCAVDPLLAVLAGEQCRDVYHGIYSQDAFPAWPGGGSQFPVAGIGDLPADIAEIPEEGAISELLNRWRLKQAVIEALGLLGDSRAVQPIVDLLVGTTGGEGIGMDGGDFYPVRKAAVEALGRIGGAQALDVLAQFQQEYEVNTRYAARLAWHDLQDHHPYLDMG